MCYVFQKSSTHWHACICCSSVPVAQVMDEVVMPASKDVGGLTEGTMRELTENSLQVCITQCGSCLMLSCRQ